MKTITLPRISLGIAILMMAVGASMVKASTIYSYTGNDFTTAPAPYSTSDKISGSFTVATALGDNLSYQTVTPTSYSFFDGVNTFDNTGYIGGPSGMQISTNAAGQITEWIITFYTPGFTAGLNTQFRPEVDVEEDSTVLMSGSFAQAYVLTPGSWTEVTPEPSTCVLIPTGLLALAVLARKRKIQGNRPTPQ